MRARCGTLAVAAGCAPAPRGSLAVDLMDSSAPALPASSASSRTSSQRTLKEFAQVTHLHYIYINRNYIVNWSIAEQFTIF